eukprot:6510480-Prymnesium_polylepis.1
MNANVNAEFGDLFVQLKCVLMCRRHVPAKGIAEAMAARSWCGDAKESGVSIASCMHVNVPNFLGSFEGA